MAHSSLTHPRERLSQLAINVLDTKPEVNFQSGRFYIQETEFESRIATISFQFWRIKAFSVFVKDNFKKVVNKGFVHGDLALYSDFLNLFLSKEFSDPKDMFRKICRQFPFEFLIMFDQSVMPVKILTCPCTKDYFIQTGVPVIKHLVHFHCKYEEKKHEMFVHFCCGHPFGSTTLNIIDSNGDVNNKCFCGKKKSHELCQMCITILYSLNFRVHKICLEKLPDFMKPRVKTLNEYLGEINCDTFFYWDRKNSRVEISLDNPQMPKITAKTDNRPVLYRS